ncbi:MAG: YggS family pyridoxal phosphate-dependent enzyme [Armatimonadota bacterium]
MSDIPLVMELTQRLAEVREAISNAARRSGRPAESVRLVAVTKTHPAPLLQAAVQAGMTEIGENYIQEAAEKFQALGWPEAAAGPAPAIRHAIGHLQANKVRTTLRWFDVIQTVDSFELADRIDRIARELGRDPVPVLIQVNTSGEMQKFGIFSDDVEGLLLRLANLTFIRVTGLMTIGRFEPEPEAARQEFIALRELRDRLRRNMPPGIRLDELSMGMSHDFPVAIEEGATIVRVGSRLFGPRPPQ